LHSYISCYTRSAHTHLIFFFFNDTATTEIYTLSLHDALPISISALSCHGNPLHPDPARAKHDQDVNKQSILLAEKLGVPVVIDLDRKSTRLNSSHVAISYAVFCLKKKKRTAIKGRG